MSERLRARRPLLCHPKECPRSRGVLRQRRSEVPAEKGWRGHRCCAIRKLNRSQRPLLVQVRNSTRRLGGSSVQGQGSNILCLNLHWASQGFREGFTSIPRDLPPAKGHCTAESDVIGKGCAAWESTAVAENSLRATAALRQALCPAGTGNSQAELKPFRLPPTYAHLTLL